MEFKPIEEQIVFLLGGLKMLDKQPTHSNIKWARLRHLISSKLYLSVLNFMRHQPERWEQLVNYVYEEPKSKSKTEAVKEAVETKKRGRKKKEDMNNG